MSYESFKQNRYTLTDEAGNEIDFEVIGQMEYAGTEYLAMIPVDTYLEMISVNTEIKDECEYVILKMVTDGDEKMLTTIDDDEEFELVADRFDALFAADIEND